MQIVFSYPPFPVVNLLTEALETALRQHRSEDTITPWEFGSPVPPGDFEVMLALGKVARERLQAFPNLALVQTLSAGYEGVDIDAATERGIWVSYAPSDRTGNADSVAELAVLHLLALSRRLLPAVESVARAGNYLAVLTPALQGKSICLVGIGGIGKAILSRLRPFGMHITAVTRNPENAPPDLPTRPLSELKPAIAEADFVVLCLRATDENRHLFDAPVLSAMKRGATLINIARGSLIDEAALHDALTSGHLQAAGLDVLEREPPQRTDPLVQLPQVMVTPHMAGFTDIMVEGLVAYVLNVLDHLKHRQHFGSLINQPPTPRVILNNAPSHG